MVYQGSKSKLKKYIIPIIQKQIDRNGIENYYEPFCGGCNVIDGIGCKNKFGSDANRYLIALLQHVQENPTLSDAPETCDFEHYKEVREHYKKDDGFYPDWYIGLIGFSASYGGRFFDGGYGRDKTGKRDIYAERVKNLREQAMHLKDIVLECKSYETYNPADYSGCLFYIDAAYKDTKQYGKYIMTDYDKFYNWLRELGKNNIVLISEYAMPEDFTCIWTKDVKVMQKADRTSADKAVEKIFTI